MPVRKRGWIGVDFDGTLAVWRGNYDIMGPPIPLMVERVRGWLRSGYDVKIFTARVSHTDCKKRAAVETVIRAWCRENIGQELEVTNAKDFSCLEIWDDKAVTVIKDTGMTLREKLNGTMRRKMV